MGARRDQWIRGIQFDALSLRLADELSERRGCSRSQLVRWLIRQAAASDAQLGLPGLGDEPATVAGAVKTRSGRR